MTSGHIQGCGSGAARLMIVGDFPSPYDLSTGRPLSGPAGAILDDWLTAANLSRDECYITYVSKFIPPNNDINKLDLLSETSLDAQIRNLKLEVRTIQPNCILALGEEALQILTGNRGITKWRGSILPFVDGYPKVVATFHPSAFTYEYVPGQQGKKKTGAKYQYIHISKLDVERAVAQSRFKEFNLPKRNLHIAKNAVDVIRFFDRNLSRSRFSVDVETLKQGVTCVGLSFDGYEGISIPLLNKGKYAKISDITDSDLRIIWKLLDEKLQSSILEKIGQNFKFDQEKLEDIGFSISGLCHDLMILGHTLCPEYPAKSLQFWVSLYTLEPYYKDEYKEYNPAKDKIDRVLLYNAKDAVVTTEVFKCMMKELQEDPILTIFYFMLPQKLHQFYYDIQSRGFLLDIKEQRELYDRYVIEINEIQNRLWEIAGHEFNLGSWQQVAKVAYEELGIPRRKGTDEDTFIALLANVVKNETHREFLEQLLEVRRLKKTVSTYIDIAPDVDGRLKTSYNIVGTETGRSSTSKPDEPMRPYPQGAAFQTITKRGKNAVVRKMFTWDPAFYLVEIDYSNAEGWITALLAQDYDLIELMKSGVDAHRLTASWFFGKRCGNITISEALTMTRSGQILDMSDVNSNERYVGKKGRHGGNYGEGKKTLMMDIMTEAKKHGIDVHVSEWKCGKILDTFHSFSPNVRKIYHSEIRDCVSSTRVLQNPFGRKRTFLGRPDDSMYREAFATIPQGTVPDAIRLAALRAIEIIGENTIIVEWHDSVQFLAPKTEWGRWASVYKTEMERPIDFSTCSLSRGSLIIPSEITVYEKNWYEKLKK